jgi:hypothetical protein
MQGRRGADRVGDPRAAWAKGLQRWTLKAGIHVL